MAKRKVESGILSTFSKAVALDNILETVIFLTPDLEIIWANNTAERELGINGNLHDPRPCFEHLRHKNSLVSECRDCPVINALHTQKPAEGDIQYNDQMFHVTAYPVVNNDGEIEGVVRNAIEVTQCRQNEKQLTENENRFKELADFLPETVFEIDRSGKTIFVNKNSYATFGYTEEELPLGFNVMDHIILNDRARLARSVRSAIKGRNSGRAEYTCIKKDGSSFPAIICFSSIVRDDTVTGLRGILFDMTEIKKTENQLRFLNSYDSLTGLYNRPHFEREMQRMQSGGYDPVGLMIYDLDGLKLINDTMGHSKGDAHLITVGDLLRKTFGYHAIIARVGGDEFAMLLPKISEKEIAEMTNLVRSNIETFNTQTSDLPLNISVGYAVRNDPSMTMEELFKQADNNMYREKLHRKESARSSIVKTLTKAMEARDFVTEGHAKRLCSLVVDLAEAVGYPESALGDLSLFAQFHDLGKVGIPDHILFKPGPLNPEERAKMQQHSEIGHRIALSSPDLVPIADWVLKHHEWWNGKGYPLKLKGNSIPLECRMLAIADAYDAITNDRPYRAARSHEEALQELQRCAGKQFDKDLVKEFIIVKTKGFRL